MTLPARLPDDLEEGLEGFEALDLDDALLVATEESAERIRLIEFVWETGSGLQPVLFLERQFLH